MKCILTIAITFTCSLIFGQTSLTYYSTDLPAQDSLEVQLIDIEKSKYVFYFRLFLSGQTIEIFSQDNETFSGKIINSIKEYNQVKVEGMDRTKAIKLYSEEVPIESIKAAALAHQIIESGQFSIPTDTLIENWTRWYLHCGNLNFEIKKDGKYLEQSFHCPWRQADSIKYKDVILSNYDLLIQELKLDSIYQNFWSQLPKGKTYSRSGYGMTYLMSDEEEIAWKNDKPRRDYLKSIKDTVDSYLKMRLKEIQATSDSVNKPCYSAHLIFGKNGKLKEIRTNRNMELSDGLTWYIEDWIEDRRCKKAIKRIFKKIDLSSFNLEHEVHRTFYKSSGEGWTISDHTIY